MDPSQNKLSIVNDLLYKTKYEELLKEHLKLKHDFSENVIIQSMNSMKDMYNEKIHELDKINVNYELLNQKYNELNKLYNELEIFVHHLETSESYLIKKKRSLEDNIKAVHIMISTLKDKCLYNDDFSPKLQFIEDILDNALYYS